MTSLLSLTVALAAHAPAPSEYTLDALNTKIRQLPGVELQSEMVSPSVVPIRFKISPNGFCWAKYPSTEQFMSAKKNVTWMPDRREYAEAAPEPGNPLPVGFHALWANGSADYRQVGATIDARFHDVDCYRLTLKGSADYPIQLFVDKATGMPKGTKVNLSGTLYEMVYQSVTARKFDDKFMQFRPPSDARPAGTFDPRAALIKPGSKLQTIRAKDASGKTWDVKPMLANHRGAVLNFWFSACTGCVAEMPFLVELAPKLAKSKVLLFGVNAIDSDSVTRQTSTLNKLPYPTLVGEGAKALTSAVSVQAYPVTVVIDPNGTVIDAIMGFDEARLTKALDAL